MKKLLYFLIGLFLSLSIGKAVYADCNPAVDLDSLSVQLATQYTGYSDSPCEASWADSQNDAAVFAGGFTTDWQMWGGYRSAAYSVDGCYMQCYYKIYPNYSDDGIMVRVVWYSSNASCQLCPPVTDTDGDGLNDDADMYPNDPTPYSIRLIGYQTVDGTSYGEHARETYITDRGDIFSIGADYDENKTDVLSNGMWINPDTLGQAYNSDESQDDLTTQTTAKQPTYSTDVPTGETTAKNDTGMQSGTNSTGSETGDAALQGIIDNTGKTATNVQRLGDYLQDMNAAIANMDRNISRSTGEGTPVVPGESEGGDNSDIIENDNTNRATDQATATTGETNLLNYDVVAALGDNISGELTEGPDGDYQAPGDLSDETWLTGFIDQNPLKTVFDNSGFQYVSAGCTSTLDLGTLGTHELNICDLDAGFVAFGNLLVAFTALVGMIHVATGRGF